MKHFISGFIFISILFFTGCGHSIHEYSQAGNLQGVQKALGSGAYIDARDPSKYTPLHKAVDAGRLNVVKYLVERGADIEARTIHGDTPLIRAAYKGHLSLVKYLVQKGAKLNAESNSGVTPLITASGHGRFAIVKYLVQSGADINYIAKRTRQSAYKIALKYNKTAIINYFDKVLAQQKNTDEKKQKEQQAILVQKEQKKDEELYRSKVNAYLLKNDFEGLKKYTDENPNAVYFIEDKMIRLMLTGPKGLKVGDIRKLVKKGRSERIITSLIKRVRTPYKEYTLDEIDILVEMGLSDNIIASMIDVTTQLLKDEQRRKEQEYYLNEQKRIAQENSKTRIIRERVVNTTNTNSNSSGNELVNTIGKEVGKEIGKKLLEELF